MMEDNTLSEGIITKGVGGTYTVRRDDEERILCQIRGGIRKSGVVPAVGDRVKVSESGDPDIPYVIDDILPRSNYLIRPAVANIDCLILTFAVQDPVPDLTLTDKLIIICSSLGIRVALLFTKCDLDPEKAKELTDIYRKAGFDVFVSSKDALFGPDDLVRISPSGIAAFAGPSGVGKSTICNNILENDIMQTGSVSDRLKRGKHTTRHVELFDTKTGFITDTPGFTSLSLFDIGTDYREVVSGYPEILKSAQRCRFDDCRHISETGCAVLEDLAEGIIDRGRYERYKDEYEYLYENRNNYKRRIRPV